MLLSNKLFHIGKITKPHGIKGNFIIQQAFDISFSNHHFNWLFISINQQLIPFAINTISQRNNQSLIVAFNNEHLLPSQINCILGCEVFIDKALIKDLICEEERTIFLLKGFKVTDKKYGEIGIVHEITSNANNPIIHIIYNNKEILLPANNKFIKKIDTENNLVYIEAPDGLIDFYLHTS